MESRTQATALSDWLLRYSREREVRQQAEEVVRRLAGRMPGLFVSTAPRVLTEAEVEEVVAGLLAYCELLVGGVTMPSGVAEPSVVAA